MTTDIVDAFAVLAPFLEPLARGRRAVIFGNATDSLGLALLDRGARLVHLYDEDATRAAEASARHRAVRALVIAPLVDGDIAVRDGAFDLAVVPDLSVFKSPEDIVRTVARLVGPDGAAFFATPNRDASMSHRETELGAGGLAYYEFYDLVSLQFPEVRMFGQAPFAGCVIADFAPEDEPDVTVDTSLMEHGAEEPQTYIAIGSQGFVQLDPYAIVQLPMASPEAPVTRAGAEPPHAQTGLAEANARLESLQRELANARSHAQGLAASPEVQARIEQLESELGAREQELRTVEVRAGDEHVRAGRLEGKVRDLEEELRGQRERAMRLAKEVEEEKKLRTKVDLELGMLRRGSELSAGPQTEVLEAELKASNARQKELQGELERSQGRARQLEQRLESVSDERADLRAAESQVRQRIAELERSVASRDARIAQLDATVVQLSEAVPTAVMIDQKVQEVLKERDQAVTLMEQMRHEQENDVTQIEQRLAERAKEIQAQRGELAHQERLVRELLSMLEEKNAKAFSEEASFSPPALKRLGAQLDGLAALAAKQEAALQQAAWRIEELNRAGLAPDSGAEGLSDDAVLERALADAHAEIGTLRKSLAESRSELGRTEPVSSHEQPNIDLDPHAAPAAACSDSARLDARSG